MAKHPITDEEVFARMAKLGDMTLSELERRGLDVRGVTPRETAQKLKRLKRKLRSEPREPK